MKTYELTYLITPEVAEEGAKETQSKLVSSIQEKGGIIEGERQPLLKKLAYSIKKRPQAFLAVVVFQLTPEKLTELEKEIKENELILRQLFLSKAKQKKEKEPRLTKRRKIEPKKEGEKTGEKRPKTELKEIENKLEEILAESQ
jgi:small subunit ribosomal protein S6